MPTAINAASRQSTAPLSANVPIATALQHSAMKFFRPFIWWMSVIPLSPSAASIRMPAPAPK